MPRKSRIRWSPDLVRTSLAGHSLLGLVFAALLYQVCLTGTISVFSAELKRWEQPTGPVVETVSPEAYANAAAAALEQIGSAASGIVILGPTPALPRLEVRMPGKDGGGLADATGTVRDGVRTPWTSFVVHLHDELHLPAPWGRIAVALSGAVLLALIVTGICAHPRIFRDAFHLRLGRASRLGETDLHNRLSVWALPFHIAVTLTGTILALAGLVGPILVMLAYDGDLDRGITDLFGPQATAERIEPAPLPDIAALIRRIEADHEPAKVSFVEIDRAGTTGQVLRLGTDTPHDLASGENYHFASDGRPLGPTGFADGSAGKQMIAALAPLHYGTFGAFTIRVIYGALGLALCVICATGVNIWLMRRRDQGRRSDGWARAWIAVVWGQPIALALPAFASPESAVGLPLLYLLASAAVLALAAWPAPPERLRHLLRLGTAAALAALAAANVAVHGLRADDPMALPVNAALVLLATMVAGSALRANAQAAPRAA